MLHTESPSSLLPQFPSWSLVCLGSSCLYSHNIGLQETQHPGFLNSTAYLLPWDVTVRLEHHPRDRYWNADKNKINSSPIQRGRKTKGARGNNKYILFLPSILDIIRYYFSNRIFCQNFHWS